MKMSMARVVLCLLIFLGSGSLVVYSGATDSNSDIGESFSETETALNEYLQNNRGKSIQGSDLVAFLKDLAGKDEQLFEGSFSLQLDDGTVQPTTSLLEIVTTQRPFIGSEQVLDFVVGQLKEKKLINEYIRADTSLTPKMWGNYLQQPLSYAFVLSQESEELSDIGMSLAHKLLEEGARVGHNVNRKYGHEIHRLGNQIEYILKEIAREMKSTGFTRIFNNLSKLEGLIQGIFDKFSASTLNGHNSNFLEALKKNFLAPYPQYAVELLSKVCDGFSKPENRDLFREKLNKLKTKEGEPVAHLLAMCFNKDEPLENFPEGIDWLALNTKKRPSETVLSVVEEKKRGDLLKFIVERSDFLSQDEEQQKKLFRFFDALYTKSKGRVEGARDALEPKAGFETLFDELLNLLRSKYGDDVKKVKLYSGMWHISLLEFAAYRGDENLVQRLLTDGFDPDGIATEGRYPRNSISKLQIWIDDAKSYVGDKAALLGKIKFTLIEAGAREKIEPTIEEPAPVTPPTPSPAPDKPGPQLPGNGEPPVSTTPTPEPDTPGPQLPGNGEPPVSPTPSPEPDTPGPQLSEAQLSGTPSTPPLSTDAEPGWTGTDYALAGGAVALGAGTLLYIWHRWKKLKKKEEPIQVLPEFAEGRVEKLPFELSD